MQIIEITDKKQLNDFVGSQKMSQFLQSWEWGEFQEKVSGSVRRLGVLDNGQLAVSATIIAKKLPMGKRYWYCPRGPVIGIMNNELRIMEIIFTEIDKLAKQEGAIFFRFEPLSAPIIHNSSFIIQKTLDVQPSKTLVLDLTESEDELLAQMHQKTRYNINLAAKKGVEIVEAGESRFAEFWRLLSQTGDRDKFNLHERDYYKTMLTGSAAPAKLFLAQYQGRTIAGALVNFFGDTATYLHGGSADQERNVMAPYLLQWHLIKLAKALGKKYYDFYGISQEKWPGVTRFKKGFGGQGVDYPGTFDLVFRPGWYGVYRAARRVRRTF